MNKHISQFPKLRGTVLVVGGGPSVPHDLSLINEPVNYCLSANLHAIHANIQPTAIVCKDHIHTESKRPMRELIQGAGVPVISQQYWADYRLTNWKVQVNSGLLAILVAHALGADKIIPVGFDFYRNGTYFHDHSAKNVSAGKAMSEYRRKLTEMTRRLHGAHIQPMSGELCRWFKGNVCGDPAENLREEIRQYEPVPVRAIRPFQPYWDTRVTIPRGEEFMSDTRELRRIRQYVEQVT